MGTLTSNEESLPKFHSAPPIDPELPENVTDFTVLRFEPDIVTFVPGVPLFG